MVLLRERKPFSIPIVLVIKIYQFLAITLFSNVLPRNVFIAIVLLNSGRRYIIIVKRHQGFHCKNVSTLQVVI